ncbi:MAG: riboflavin synthase, partial [Chloroflexi bacterium]|nr:riboflavin synthase [Chloroflexota bacterium]
HITLAQRRPGDPVNIEVDIIGKYVERFVAAAQPAQSLTREFLVRHGFA